MIPLPPLVSNALRLSSLAFRHADLLALYHMGIYADSQLLDWFIVEYPNHCKRKLDMGKSCIRFKKVEEIPFDLIAQLMKKMKMKDWMASYEKKY